MASPKSTIKSARPTTSYDEPCEVECSESPLSTIYSNSSVQHKRLIEINHLVDDLLSHLGIGGPCDTGDKIAVAPYGRLEEIRESQNNVFRSVNELENKIYDLRNALM